MRDNITWNKRLPGAEGPSETKRVRRFSLVPGILVLQDQQMSGQLERRGRQRVAEAARELQNSGHKDVLRLWRRCRRRAALGQRLTSAALAG